MIYIAAPYSHQNPLIRAERSRKAGKAMWELARAGVPAIAPTFYGHEFEGKFRAELPYEFWLVWSRGILVKCSEVYVLPLEGWRESLGLESELTLAASLWLPITGYPCEGAEDVSGFDIRKQFDLPITRAKFMRQL